MRLDPNIESHPFQVVLDRYVTALFKQFVHFDATREDFDRLLGLRPGDVTEEIYTAIRSCSAKELFTEMITPSSKKQQNVALKVYGLCMWANHQGVDPDTWPQPPVRPISATLSS
jgi:hypothetical protein